MTRVWFRRLAFAAVILCFVVVVLGGWVRLSTAGLGCPDWPTCYGHLSAGGALENQAAANAAYPDRPLEYGKAVREMVHRYAASTLGLLILIMAVWAVANRRDPEQPVAVPLVLVGTVILQGMLGMLTVTWLLKPLIVTLHLLGGMTTLGLLWWVSLRKSEGKTPLHLHHLAIVGLIVLGAQIALGGWTSSNYAAVACPDFPTCQNQWWPNADFRDAFVLWRGLGIDYEGGVLDHPARVAIHFVHRLGALVTTVVLGILAALAIAHGHNRGVRLAGIAIVAALAAQLAIGIAMVTRGFPLPIATAHNAGAALLLLTVVTLLRYLCGATTGNSPNRA